MWSILFLVTAIKGSLSEFSIFHRTSTFKSTDSLSSTEDKIPKNNRFWKWLRIHWTSLSLSCIVWENFAAGHHPEESTILGKIPLKEQAPVACDQTFCAKIKVLLPLHLHPSQAPPAGISTLLLMVLKKSWEDLHPGKIFKNYLPTSCIASSRHEHLPSHSSCSLGPLKFEIWTLSMVWRSRGSL